MSVIIRLQGLPWTASALDIRNFFQGLQIPAGGVHIIGGEKGDAFIAFVTDEDARQGMMKTYQSVNGSPVQLLLSSKTEMQNVIDAARTGQAPELPAEPVTRPPPVEPAKPYEDPFYRVPPAQDMRGGYGDDYSKYGGPDTSQEMYGNEQQGYKDEFVNRPPPDLWIQNKYPEEGFPPENRDPYGSRDPPREVPPRGSFDRDGPPRDGPPRDGPPRDGPPRDGPPRDGPPRDGPPRDGPPINMRNQGMPNDRFQDPFYQNLLPDQHGSFDRPPIGDPAFEKNQGPPFGMNDPAGPMDRRPPHELRRPEIGGDMRRGPEGRYGEGRDIREGRDARDRDRDGRDRDRRERPDRDRSERDRFDRDRPSRFDRSDRSERGDRPDRPERFDRSDRPRRDQDRDRRDHSEPRRDLREPRDMREPRDRPPFEDKPFDQRNSPMSRSSREPPPRNDPRGPPGRTGPDPYGQHDGSFEGNMPEFNQQPDQFPPGDNRRRPDDFQGPYPPRDRGSERPKSRFDQELPPGRFGPDDRMPPPNKDPDFRSEPRGPPGGPRGRGQPPMFPDQGSNFDRDGRQPDRDFRGGPPGEPGFPPRPPQQGPPQGRGRPMDGPPPGMRPPGFRDEGYPREPNERPKFPPEDVPWERDSRFPPNHGPGGAQGRPPSRSDFIDKRPGGGPPNQKGLLGDAPTMFPGGRGPMDRPDMPMDHDGREPQQRNFMPDRQGPGPFRDKFGRPGDPKEFHRGDDFEGRPRYRGSDMDQRSNREERGPRPMVPDHDRRRPDWGPDGKRDGRWPEDMSRGPPRRPMEGDMHDKKEGPDHHGFPPRDRSQQDEQNRKRPRPSDSSGIYVHMKNLPYSVSYSMVRRFFLGCDIPYDGLKLINNEQGKRNGTGYIRFMTEEACFNALQRNGMDLGGRNIVVYRCSDAEFERAVDSFVPDDEDEEPEPAKRPRSDEQQVNKQSSNDKSHSLPPAGEPFIVKINNLPLNVSAEEIKKLFSGVKIAEGGATLCMEYASGGAFTGTACVEVQTAEDYTKAMGLEGRHMGSRIIRVISGSKSDMSKIKSSQPKGDGLTSKKETAAKNGEASEKKDAEKGQGDEDYPFTCAHVVGLPHAATFRELRELVSGLEVAPRGIQICHDGQGNPIGEGFIEFTNKKDCKEAQKRNKNLVAGKPATIKPILKSEMILRLRNARNINSRPPPGMGGPGGPMGHMGPGGPMGPGPGGMGPGGPGPGGPPPIQGPPSNAKPIPPGVLKRQWVYLRCSNLPLQVTIRELLGFFHQYNPVPESIRLHYTGDGNPTGNAVVGFPSKEEASKAMTDLNGTLCRRNTIVIQPASS